MNKKIGGCLIGGALLLLCSVAPATAQVSIGINLTLFPELRPVPGYPVYYAPEVDSNYFFYDGMYWVYQGDRDRWYASSWYNGPWAPVGPEFVPVFLLRVPVRYYREPPPYFRGWRSDRPPHWGEHWGHEWEQQRSGWDQWDRRSAPRPAPLPVYQRQYSGDRYPQQVEQQQALQSQRYRYQPHDPVVRQHYQAQQQQPQNAPPSARHVTQEAPPQQGQQRAVHQQQQQRQQQDQQRAAQQQHQRQQDQAAQHQHQQKQQQNQQRAAQEQQQHHQQQPEHGAGQHQQQHGKKSTKQAAGQPEEGNHGHGSRPQ
jgi:hypothetical protein